MSPYFLSENYLLRGATIGDVESIHAICEIREFAAGQSVVAVSDKGTDIMVVIEGRVRVETLHGDAIDELRAGAMIGEISFIDGKPRTANVTAVNAAKICRR